jgi:HEAT repeat protein
MIGAVLTLVLGMQAGPTPEELVDRLRQAQGKSIGQASQDLINLGPRAIPVLTKMLQGPESDRRLAVPVLTNIRDRESMKVLSRVALDPKEVVGIRITAAYGIGNMQFPDAYPTLSKLATDSSAYMKWSGVYGLGRIGDPRALPLLRRFEKSKDKTLAWMAKDSIKTIKMMVAKYPDRLKGVASGG